MGRSPPSGTRAVALGACHVDAVPATARALPHTYSRPDAGESTARILACRDRGPRMLTADELIALLDLAPLPIEGGWFRQTYLADESVDAAALPARYVTRHALSSAIYYLLRDADFSALHRLPTDEVYHFYLGQPVELLRLYPDGTFAVTELGSDLAAGQQVQVVVPRGVWQGSRLLQPTGCALLGTTMAPAYDPAEFELGERTALLRDYPRCADHVRALTHAGKASGSRQ